MVFVIGYILYTTQIIFYVLSIGLATLICFLLKSTSILHNNLRVILVWQSIALFLEATGAFATLLCQMDTRNDADTLFRRPAKCGSSALLMYFGEGLGGFIAPVMFIERGLATFYVRTYERRRRPTIAVVGIALTVSCFRRCRKRRLKSFIAANQHSPTCCEFMRKGVEDVDCCVVVECCV